MVLLLEAQQFSDVSYIASDIESKLRQRVDLLNQNAALAAEHMGSADDMATFLGKRIGLQALFAAGIVVIGDDGNTFADYPRLAERSHASFTDVDFYQEVLRTGETVISKPRVSRFIRKPGVAIAAPIRDPSGRVIGILVGFSLFSDARLFGEIEQRGVGKSGLIQISSPRYSMVVTSNDPTRILQPLPPPTSNDMLDRIFAGFEGSGLYMDEKRHQSLISAKAIPVAGWVVHMMLPTKEAFAPIKNMEDRAYAIAGGLTILAGLAVWLMIKRTMAPLGNAASIIRQMAQGVGDMHALALVGDTEVLDLFESFNTLVGQRKEAEGKLLAAKTEAEEARQRNDLILASAGEGICVLDAMGKPVLINEAARRMLGWNSDEEISQTFHALTHHHRYDGSEYPLEECPIHGMLLGNTNGKTVRVDDEVFWRQDGTNFPVEYTATAIINREGKVVGAVNIFHDISQRKLVEQQLLIAATAFESQEGMIITDADSVILRVNRAFSEITGYTADEAVGRKTSLLKSGRHDPAFYMEMWKHIDHQGAWQGEVWNRRKNGEVYPEWLTITAVKGSNGEVTHYVATLSDITLRKAAEDEIKHLAFYDPLTRLPNRRLLLDRLHQALASAGRSRREGALLFIDLDNFKTLNDTLGHDVGDILLQQVGQRISACIREGDTVARLGGDEFVVMLEDLSSNLQEAAAQTETVAGKILTALNHPYLLAGQNQRSTPSIGATLFHGNQLSVEELLKRADVAMYQAKAAGRNTLRFFDPEMQAAISAQAALEADLRQGIMQEQFILYYQPQVDGGAGLLGAEALIRWQHPERGLVSPAEFIPVAEETGMILPLGAWVLETSCNQLVIWAGQPEAAHLTLAVNVSARQFRQPDFVNQVLAVLDRTGANPRKLKLELTESLLLADVQDVIAKMTALKAKGVCFSLDDFGTGYSSLSYLKRLPLDQLKIDQSFVRDVLVDINDGAIAQTIIALGQTMGLAVIAEGVETEEQCEFLARIGCNTYQGYFFSRPLPLEGFEQFARQR